MRAVHSGALASCERVVQAGCEQGTSPSRARAWQSRRSESSEDGSSHHGGRRKSCLSSGIAKTEQQLQDRKVAFHEIEIREFPVGLGDNPAVLSGPPVALEWESQKTYVLSVDAYEGAMGEGTRRRGKELKMPSSVREELLKGAYSQEEIRQATKAARRVRSQRSMAVATADIEHIEEFVQSFGRMVKRWRRRRSSVALDPAEEWVENHKKSSRKVRRKDSCSTVTTVSSSEDADNNEEELHF